MTETTGLCIRRATLDDADAIAEAHLAAWQTAYRGQLPDEVLDSLTIDAYRTRWRGNLSTPSLFTTRVVETGGRVRGFASTGPARDADLDPARVGELLALYLHPDAWRQGLGQALLEASIAALRDAGFRTVTLWVLETNVRARRFYERAGFAPDGSRQSRPLMGVRLEEVRYRREVRGAHPGLPGGA
jgi:ribosomal protein S18 acetylase RimI-like enzyme